MPCAKARRGSSFLRSSAGGSFPGSPASSTIYWLLVVDRLLLGVAESLIFPSMLILLTNWFTRAERSRANAILILGNPVTVTWMAAVTGYLIQAVGWQMTFILEGIPSVLWAFVWMLVARDRPHRRPRGCRKASSAPGSRWRWNSSKQSSCPSAEIFARRCACRAYCCCAVQYFCWSFGVYGLVFWIPAMIRSGSARGIEQLAFSAPRRFCWPSF